MNGIYCLVPIIADLVPGDITLVWDDPELSLAEVAFSVFRDIAEKDPLVTRGLFLRLDEASSILIDSWSREDLECFPSFSEEDCDSEPPFLQDLPSGNL